MREIDAEIITGALEKMCIRANTCLEPDIEMALKKAYGKESGLGREIIDILVKNAEMARNEGIPICQDTGMAGVFVEVGQDVQIKNGALTQAINEGIRRGYKNGYLRKSVVKDPFIRKNTEDNTPAVIHYDIKEGSKIKITLAPKGFGSENMSALAMLKPSDGEDGVKKFIINTIEKAGSNPCPPVVVGVGIGGTMEKAAFMSKKALTRPLGIYNELEHIKNMEIELLKKINCLGIGPSGIGGKVTALGVNIDVFPTHIAGLPVAVNINCHASRHLEVII